jgi:hypothetical protein
MLKAYCKHIFQVFQMFQRFVVSVSYRCCKSRSGCCICCNSCTRMLQTLFPNVSYVFRTYVASVFIWILHIFHIYVASVLSRCCVCLQWFSSVSGVFQVFQTHISSVSFVSFLYVASVASRYFKSRSDVAHEMRVGSRRGRERSLRGRNLGGAGPAWARKTQAWADDVRAAWASRGRANGAQKQTAAAGVRPNVQALAMPYSEVTLFFLSH